MTEDRIAHLLGKIHTDLPLTAAEHSDCLRLGVNPRRERPVLKRHAELAVRSGCSERTFRSIFG